MPFEGSLTQLRVECGGPTLRAPRSDDIDNLMAVYDDDCNLEPQPRPKRELARARQGILTRIERNPHPFLAEWWGQGTLSPQITPDKEGSGADADAGLDGEDDQP